MLGILQYMTWASRRQFFIISILVMLFVSAVGAVVFAVVTIEPEPTCRDGVQNQTETGIDCGGTCAYLCVAEVTAPAVSFIRAVDSGSRIDAVASVTNRNTQAAVKSARYTIELFDTKRVLVGVYDGTVDLPPNAVVPIFVPNVLAASTFDGQAFLTFEDSSLRWYREPRTTFIPPVEETRLTNGPSPEVRATVRNTSAFALRDVALVATVFDAVGTPIGASQTLVRDIEARGSASATFFWNAPFSATPGRVEVRAVPVLP